ncbi:MAG: translation initiation factor IF-2 subunit alpha [Nitrosopumilaceae archaeon]
MTTEVQELPEVGDIVVATVTKIMDQGAYVSLDEYNNIQGFLHISEIATGWIRHVEKFVKVGEKKILLVKRVNSKRSEIDLSLKQVSNDQKKKKILELKRNEKERLLIENLKTKGGLSKTEVEKLEEILVNKFNSVYDAFSEIVSKGIGVLDGLNLSKKVLSAIEEISSKIQVPHVEIRGVLELTCTKPNGIEIIKKALLDAMENKDANIEVIYIGAPKYRLTISALDFKTAEKVLKPLLSTIQTTIEKKGGTYKFTREESKKTREG